MLKFCKNYRQRLLKLIDKSQGKETPSSHPSTPLDMLKEVVFSFNFHIINLPSTIGIQLLHGVCENIMTL